jgi:hypothetical protein
MKTKSVNRAVENDFSQFRDKQILSVFNELSPRPISGFMDRQAMERRTQDLLDMQGFMIYHENNGGALYQIDGVWIYRAESHPSNVQALGHVHRDSNRVIRMLIDHNPKKLKSAERFALYRDGMTVYEYRMACRTAQGGNAYQISENDIEHDVRKGFIRIEINSEQELAEHAARTILRRSDP